MTVGAVVFIYRRAEKREVSIRKILGASSFSIISMLSKEFNWLVIIAFFIAMPISWYLMQGWLEDFAYRVTVRRFSILNSWNARCADNMDYRRFADSPGRFGKPY